MKGMGKMGKGGAGGREPMRGETGVGEETEAFFSRRIAVVTVYWAIWKRKEKRKGMRRKEEKRKRRKKKKRKKKRIIKKKKKKKKKTAGKEGEDSYPFGHLQQYSL